MDCLLDTVTVSELRRGTKAHPGVVRWQRTLDKVGLSVSTLNEIRYGMRKVERSEPPFAAHLVAWYANLLAQPERFRIPNVDRPIAEIAADFRAAHGISFNDSLIAATAKVHNLMLITLNMANCEATGKHLVDPWEFGEG